MAAPGILIIIVVIVVDTENWVIHAVNHSKRLLEHPDLVLWNKRLVHNLSHDSKLLDHFFDLYDDHVLDTHVPKFCMSQIVDVTLVNNFFLFENFNNFIDLVLRKRNFLACHFYKLINFEKAWLYILKIIDFFVFWNEFIQSWRGNLIRSIIEIKFCKLVFDLLLRFVLIDAAKVGD